MSSLPSSMAEATPRRASDVSTYFLTRIILAISLTGMDVFVVLKSAVEGLRDSDGMPMLHGLLVLAVVGVVLSLAVVWSKTLRYRQPSRPNSTNPFL